MHQAKSKEPRVGELGLRVRGVLPDVSQVISDDAQALQRTLENKP